MLILRVNEFGKRKLISDKTFEEIVDIVDEIRPYEIDKFKFYCKFEEPYEKTKFLSLYPEDKFFETDDGFLIVKPDINKIGFASRKSIKNFAKKIKEKIFESDIKIIFNEEDFEILIDSAIGYIKLICDYGLNINKSFALAKDTFIEISKSDEIVKIVNKIFVKQRCYYKRKEK